MTERKQNSITDLTSRRIGRLTVQKLIVRKIKGASLWLCRCRCGKTKIARHECLLARATRSCGCLKSDVARATIARTQKQKRAEWDAFVETMLEVVTRFPQRPRELREAFRDNWGSYHERRFWRALRLLVDRGVIERRGGKKMSGNSVYALPRRPTTAPRWEATVALSHP